MKTVIKSPGERETVFRELAEKNEKPWFPVCDTYKAGDSYLWLMLFDGKGFRYQIATWEPLHGFCPIIWGLSYAMRNDANNVAYKPSNGDIEALLEEWGYFDYIFGGIGLRDGEGRKEV